MAEVRGIREMVAAMAVLPSDSRARLNLAGNFLTRTPEEDFSKLKGWAHVSVLGFLDRTGVRELLGRVRAGLVLLHPLPRYQVALPVKLFEYMASGIPVIASDFPLWHRIIENVGCGILVDPLDSGAIANAMAYILRNPREAEAMGQRGRPVLARGTVAQEILERFQRMSQPFGTTIEVADGMGVISVD